MHSCLIAKPQNSTSLSENMKNNFVFESVLIWGHGINYLNNILQILDKNFEILYIKRKRIANIKQFVKDVYSHDYAPYWHLKEKVKYLMKVPDQAILIIMKSEDTEWDYLGNDLFRHKESLSIKRIKAEIRNEFNPKKNDGKPSEDHIIHTSDDEFQLYKIAALFDIDAHLLINNESTIKLPFYLTGAYDKFTIQKIRLTNIKARITIGKNWENFENIVTDIKNTPHYKFLDSNEMDYELYINKFIGGPITQYYNKHRYYNLSKTKYLSQEFENSYILVTLDENGIPIIIDGLHRASLLMFNRFEDALVCIASN